MKITIILILFGVSVAAFGQQVFDAATGKVRPARIGEVQAGDPLAVTIIVTNPPTQFPDGIESQSIALVLTNGSAIGIAVTPSLDVVAYIDHASPRDGWQERRDSAIASNQVKMTALRALKASSEFTSLTNQLAQYDGHYQSLTNALAGWNGANTNQLVNILTKQRQATDDLHDALVKAVKLIKDLAGNQ